MTHLALTAAVCLDHGGICLVVMSARCTVLVHHTVDEPDVAVSAVQQTGCRFYLLPWSVIVCKEASARCLVLPCGSSA